MKPCFGQCSDSENGFGELHVNQGNMNSCHDDTALQPWVAGNIGEYETTVIFLHGLIDVIPDDVQIHV